MPPSTRRIQAALDRFNRLAPSLCTESDRATAILSVAYLDELLKNLLVRRLIDQT
jgi:hypothetical protein